MKRILVFGGAFDPPHNGHIQMLLRFRRMLKPWRIIVSPTFSKPVHKDASLFPDDLRWKMLKAVFKPYKDIEVSNWELRQGRPVYTWQAVQRLHRRFPGAKIHFLIGADNKPLLNTWARISKLRRDPLLAFETGARTRESSSQIREWVRREGLKAKPRLAAGVPAPVLKIIFSPESLETRIHAYLSVHQPASRYAHTLSVTRLAEELARIYRLNRQKARLAALLHDASRHAETFKNSREAMGHAGRSAHIARSVFGVTDKEVLEAVAWHTVGHPGMGRLARLIYVADFAAYDRPFPAARRVRALARRNLNAALKKAVESKLLYLRSTGEKIHPSGLRFWASLQ